jgi:hypothetical protein
MNKKRFNILLGTILVGTLVTTSCKKEEVKQDEQTPKTFTEITTDETWKANTIHYLNGKVVVQPGVTLTIEPGTIIKGKEGVGTIASALIISRGAKINAQGTEKSPIIFTSEFDTIKVGETKSPNLKNTENQKWGGLIILGNAPVSTASGDIEGNIEGIPASDNYGKYGGNKIDDNSGVLNYVSIRHGGALIGEGNEINGLTLGGVGNRTKIENIEIYATMDDGIECFGGSVDLTNILVYYQGDDGIDLDQNYSGTIENFMVIQGDGIGTDKGLEVDGPENTTNKEGLFTLKNGLLKSQGTEGVPADFKDKAQGKILNLTFNYDNAKSKEIRIRAMFDSKDNCKSLQDAFTNLTSPSPKLTFTDNKLGLSKGKVYNGSEKDANKNPLCSSSLTAADQTNVEDKIINGAGYDLDISIFNWTNASIKGEL